MSKTWVVLLAMPTHPKANFDRLFVGETAVSSFPAKGPMLFIQQVRQI